MIKRTSLACLASILLPALAKAQIGAAPASGQLPMAQQLPLSGRTPQGSVVTIESPLIGAGVNSVNTLNPSIQVQGAYQGSAPTGGVSPQALSLGLEEAIKRGIQYNLGAIGAGEAARQARAER